MGDREDGACPACQIQSGKSVSCGLAPFALTEPKFLDKTLAFIFFL
jgi:hypothetical protein